MTKYLLSKYLLSKLTNPSLRPPILSETPIYIILAVDVIMDMARTSVNMLGNCLATVVVTKWEGEGKDL